MGALQSVYGFNSGIGTASAAASAAASPATRDGKTNQPGDVVLIAVDRSQHAEAAFEWYCKHIHRPDDVVHVLHCEELEPLNYPAFAITASRYVKSVEDAKKAAEDLVAAYEKRLKEHKISGTVHTEIGKPGEMVISCIDIYNATHIVMGTRGFGLIRRTILGSVSEYVIHHTKVPVTVVPRETTKWFF